VLCAELKRLNGDNRSTPNKGVRKGGGWG